MAEHKRKELLNKISQSFLEALPPHILSALNDQQELLEYSQSAILNFVENESSLLSSKWDTQELVETLAPFLQEVGMEKEDVIRLCGDFTDRCSRELGDSDGSKSTSASDDTGAGTVRNGDSRKQGEDAAVVGSAAQAREAFDQSKDKATIPSTTRASAATQRQTAKEKEKDKDSKKDTREESRAKPVITAISQQSRFHAESITTENKDNDDESTTLPSLDISLPTSTVPSYTSFATLSSLLTFPFINLAYPSTINVHSQVDMPGVSITVGEDELLVDARLRLTSGVHYGMIGRNGVGKSTLLRVLGSHTLPGWPTTVSVLYVEQELVGSDDKLPLESLLDVDEDGRVVVEGEVRDLESALDSSHTHTQSGPSQISLTLRRILHARAVRKVASLSLIATKRSGERGKLARKNLVDGEREEQEARKELERVEQGGTVDEVEDERRAGEMVAEGWEKLRE
ncbi:hypothetical protein HDU93_000783, partial [Gonapodya sp. JEL0774]